MVQLPNRASADPGTGPPTEAAKRLARVLERRPEVIFAYLFGSAATGRAHRRSDWDVAVLLDAEEPGTSEDGWARGSDLWAALSEAAPQREVDLVLLDRAPPLLAERVVRTGTLLFSRDEARRIAWVVATKSRHCDLAPLRGRLDEALASRVRSGRFGQAKPG